MIGFANGKINIGLHIVGQYEDGYHSIESVFYKIGLCDVLEVLKRDSDGLDLVVNGYEIEGDNIISKAYNIVKQKYNIGGAGVWLLKNIPIGSGLGGGSSDGVTALKLFDKVYNLDISSDVIEDMGRYLGSDCSFFFKDKVCFVWGRGEKVEEIDLSLKGYYYLIVKPPFSISTKEAYSKVKIKNQERINLNDAVKLPLKEWRGMIENDFEESLFTVYSELRIIKEKLYKMGALYASLSGSGSALYGIFDRDILNFDEEFKGYFCYKGVFD